MRMHVEATMPAGRNFHKFILLSFAALSFGAGAESPASPLTKVPHETLCVTEGAIASLGGEQFDVSVPKMRAYLNEYTPPVVEEQFTYLGATPNESPLASGVVRRQFGVKLRAQDACNVVYATWRIEPESKLVISVKSNPGEHSSIQCGNHGYRNVRPRKMAPLPALQAGDVHTLRAEMHRAEMRVLVDSNLVWSGSVGSEALDFDGPVGLRTDNVHLQIELRAALPLVPQFQHAPGCRSAKEESD